MTLVHAAETAVQSKMEQRTAAGYIRLNRGLRSIPPLVRIKNALCV